MVSRLQGAVDPAIPPFVGLAARTQHGPWSDPGSFGFLGPAYAPFKPDGPAMANMKLKIPTGQLQDRRRLLASFDGLKRDRDATGAVTGVDSATELAFDVLTSSRLVDALDLSKEDPRLRDRYGNGQPYKFQYDGAPTVNEHLLIARRLVEAGVRCVTLSYGRWDSHGDNFGLVRDHGAKLDQCLSALIEDLDVRGMLDDVTVIAWGEFGRTPRINGGSRPRPLAAGQLRVSGRRRHSRGPGYRRHQPARRICQGSPGADSRDRRDLVSQPRHRRGEDHRHRPDRPAPVSGRSRTTARVDLLNVRSDHGPSRSHRQAARRPDRHFRGGDRGCRWRRVLASRPHPGPGRLANGSGLLARP